MLLDGTQNMCRKQNNNKNEIIETQDTHSDSKKKVHTYIYIYTYKSIKFFYFLISVPPPVHRRPTTNCANPRGTIGRPTMTSHRPPIIVIVITGVIAPPLAAITMKIKSSLISCYESASFSVHILFLHPSRSSTTMEQKKKNEFLTNHGIILILLLIIIIINIE